MATNSSAADDAGMFLMMMMISQNWGTGILDS